MSNFRYSPIPSAPTRLGESGGASRLGCGWLLHESVMRRRVHLKWRGDEQEVRHRATVGWKQSADFNQALAQTILWYQGNTEWLEGVRTEACQPC